MRQSTKQIARDLKQRIYEHELVVTALLDSREILLCEDTGALIIGLPLALVELQGDSAQFTVYAPKDTTCDSIFDLHTPISEVKNPRVLRRALESLNQYT
jgi:hypothetical protein